MSILKGTNGKYSSKRAMGVMYMKVGLLMALVDQFTRFDINSFEVWISIVLTGASLLGISLFEYFGKGKNIEPPKPDDK